MSQDPVLVQDRTISGKGLLKVPSNLKKVRYFTLYADVLRDPTSPYLNLNYNPPRSRYATLTFMRDGYVQFEHSLDYQRQVWDFVADYTSQNLIAIKCAYKGILESFVNLGVALGVTPTITIDLIQEYEYLNLLFDEIRVVCYADTGIKLKLYNTKNDTCDPARDTPRKPPPPPPPPPKTPPKTPIPDISPPYTSDDPTNPKNGDNGDTTPAPIDIPVPPPEPVKVGVECGQYIIQFEVQASNQTFQFSGRCFGKFVPEVFVDPDNPAYLSMRCQGGIEQNACGVFGIYHIYSQGSPNLLGGTYISSSPPV